MSDHDYETRGSHDRIFDMTDREIVISGPSGTGSARACMEKMATLAQTHRGFRGLIVRKTAKSLTTSAIPIMKHKVLPELIKARMVSFENGNRWDPQRFQFRNGSTIVLDGMDDSAKIIGSEFDMVFVMFASELTLQDWEDLLLTLQGTAMGYTQLLATTLPKWPQHWLKLRCDSKRTVYLESRHEDNPEVYARVNGQLVLTDHGSDLLAGLNDLTGVNRSRNALGLWADTEGMILEKWDNAIHMIRNYEPSNDLGRKWHIDWGYSNALSWGNWVREPDGRLACHQEVYHTGLTVQRFADMILVATRGQPRPEKIVADHDPTNNSELEKILNLRWFNLTDPFDPGWYSITLAKKDVKVGIEAVNKRIKHHDVAIMYDTRIHDADPLLVRMQLPTCGVEEIPYYIWSDSNHDQPVKRGDHFCDGMRYVIMDEDSVQAMRVRMRR